MTPRLDGIVLDLDDTILDTARLLVPLADARAIAALRAAGLPLAPDALAAALRALRAEGVDDLFGMLAARNGCGPEVARAGADAFFRFEVPPLALEPEVERALDRLAHVAPLALLTAGDEATQRAKVARLGIAPRFIECVYVVGAVADAKVPALAALLARRAWHPARVVVAGDRAASDVRAANAAGCLAVLVRRRGGEFAEHEPAEARDRPWRTVPDLATLADLLEAGGGTLNDRAP